MKKKTLDEIAGIDKIKKGLKEKKLTGKEADFIALDDLEDVLSEHLDLVREWHKTFGVPINKNPDDFTQDDFDLRINLIEEELQEMKDSQELDEKRSFHIELLDALCDLQYVLSGAVLQLGFKDVFDDAFEAVHMSNMSKVIRDRHSIEEELFLYRQKGVKCTVKEVKDGWVIVRSSDSKILKPSGYTPVDLSSFL